MSNVKFPKPITSQQFCWLKFCGIVNIPSTPHCHHQGLHQHVLVKLKLYELKVRQRQNPSKRMLTKTSIQQMKVCELKVKQRQKPKKERQQDFHMVNDTMLGLTNVLRTVCQNKQPLTLKCPTSSKVQKQVQMGWNRLKKFIS